MSGSAGMAPIGKAPREGEGLRRSPSQPLPNSFRRLRQQPARFAIGEQISPADPHRHRRANIYPAACVGIVVKGAVKYHARNIPRVAIPGTVVCGNRGEEFSCIQEHPRGNRRLVIDFAQSALDELAGELDLSASAFDVPVIAPSPATALIFGWLDKIAAQSADQDELAWLVASHALCASEQERGLERTVTERELNKVLDIVRYIDAHFDEPCTLKVLSEHVGLSRFHLVRLFHAVAGQTPAQYVINTRLRAAVHQLTATLDPVTSIALDVGFNDISHFNATFRSTFCCSPLQWRRQTANAVRLVSSVMSRSSTQAVAG